MTTRYITQVAVLKTIRAGFLDFDDSIGNSSDSKNGKNLALGNKKGGAKGGKPALKPQNNSKK